MVGAEAHPCPCFSFGNTRAGVSLCPYGSLLRWRRGFFTTARGAFDVSCALPSGELGGIVAEDIADDGVEFAHDEHAALDHVVNGGGGGDAQASARR